MWQFFCLRHYQTDDWATQSGCQGEKPWIGSDLLVPCVWVVNREPVSAQTLDLVYVLGWEEPELQLHAIDQGNVFMFKLVSFFAEMVISDHGWNVFFFSFTSYYLLTIVPSKEGLMYILSHLLILHLLQ